MKLVVDVLWDSIGFDRDLGYMWGSDLWIRVFMIVVVIYNSFDRELGFLVFLT